MTTTLRLWTAALLCLLPFGFAWSGGVTPGTVVYGDCTYSDNEYCVPDQYVPGSTYHSLVSQAPIRVFLLAAALIFVGCATRVRTLVSRRVARLGCAAVTVAAVLATAHGAPRILACLCGALALVVPRVVRFRRFGEPQPGQVK